MHYKHALQAVRSSFLMQLHQQAKFTFFSKIAVTLDVPQDLECPQPVQNSLFCNWKSYIWGEKYC